MHRHCPRAVGLLASVGPAVAILAVAACTTGKSTTSPSGYKPTRADAQQLAQGVEITIDAAVTAVRGGNPAGAASRYMHGAVLHSRSAPMRGPQQLDAVPACAVVTPPNPPDADADGIPDSATYTFTAANCTFVSDSTTLVVTGAAVISDPTSSIPDASYAATTTGLQLQATGAQEQATIGITGSAAANDAPGLITQTLDDTIAISATKPTVINASLADSLIVTFAHAGGLLGGVGGVPALPAGTFLATGTMLFSTNGHSFPVTVSTPTPVTYDPACATSTHVTGGVVLATFGANASDSVRVVWTGCSDPTLQISVVI